MSTRITVSQEDLRELEAILGDDTTRHLASEREITLLRRELGRAEVVPRDELPADVVNLGAAVRIREEGKKKAMSFTVVAPRDADFDEGRISVLAPVGAAVLGYGVGDTFEWELPAGVRRFTVEHVLQAPRRSTAAA